MIGTPHLFVFTIVLDGMPWIACHYNELRRLHIPWTWIVVEGYADPVADTGWCQKLEPRLSNDGTTQYISSLKECDSRVHHLKSEIWPGKTAMCNAALNAFELLGVSKESVIILQMDSDELWNTYQLEQLAYLFNEHPWCNCADFWCNYFLGPDILITTRNSFGNHPDYGWRRAWRWKYGMRFKTHEPPLIEGHEAIPIFHHSTEQRGLVFDHMAYADPKSVAFKEKYYGQKDGLHHWFELQRNTVWPAKVSDFLPWVKELSWVKQDAWCKRFPSLYPKPLELESINA